MKNKITKFLTILSIIFISLFINKNKVEAKEFIECDYMAPLSYMDSNSLPSKIQFDFKYFQGYTYDNWAIFGGTQYKVMLVDAPSRYIDSFCISKITSNTFNLENHDVNYRGVTYNGTFLSVIVNPEIVDQGDGNNIKQSKIAISYQINNIPNSKYIKIYFENSKLPILKVKSATKDEYQSYIKNNQYINTNASNLIYNLYKISGLSTGFAQKNGDIVNGIPPLTDSESNIKKYIQSTGGIVLVNTSNPEAYPSSVWNKFKAEEDRLGVDYTNLKIDQEKTNKKTYTRDYYDATKTKWHNYMQEAINNPKTGKSKVNNEMFQYWWDKVSRYVFEEDLELYRKYFVYIYEGNTEIMSKENYNNYLDAIDHLIGSENYSDDVNCLEKNPCASYCNTSDAKNFMCSGIAFDQCTSNSQDYKTCKKAYDLCKNVPSSNYDSCMIGYMGEEKYSNLKKKNEELKKELNDLRDEELKQASDSLYRITGPSLNIDFKKKYELTCDDVEVFRVLYLIIEISAPILVILFGSIDYAKAVMASDVEKMQKIKKNFPKRLGLLLLFVFIPLIISIILGQFSNLDTKLMNCIVNGG